MIKAGIVLLALSLLLHCSNADTLGDEPVQEVVIQGQPTWENGIGELTRLKCGYCHGYPKPDIAPNDIVPDLDLNTYATRVENGVVIRGADSIGAWIDQDILDNPVTLFDGTSDPRAMPLDYGTPVTEREKAFFEVWSDAGSPENNAPPPAPGDAVRGSELYFGFCAFCHSSGEGNRLNSGKFLGPPLRSNAVTVAKIKSMWLHKATPGNPVPLSDEDAAAIRTFILTELPLEENE